MSDIVHTALRAWQLKEGHEWVVVRAAWYVVSGRVDGTTTRAYADALAVSPQMVRRWKRAWDMYQYLKGCWGDGFEMYPHPRHLRRQLTVEHFVELMELQEKYHFPPEELFATLAVASENRVSAHAMRLLLEEQASGDPVQPLWWRRLNEVLSVATHLRDDPQTPVPVRKAAQTFLFVAKPYLEAGDSSW